MKFYTSSKNGTQTRLVIETSGNVYMHDHVHYLLITLGKLWLSDPKPILSIDTSGSVGIGTTAPCNQLRVTPIGTAIDQKTVKI